MENILNSLHELKQAIPALSELLVSKMGDTIIVQGKNTVNKMVSILSEDDIGIIRAVMHPGEEYISHKHRDSVEIIVVYKGELHINIEGNIHILTPGEVLRIEKNVTHKAIAKQLTICIGLTIPCDDGYRKNT